MSVTLWTSSGFLDEVTSWVERVAAGAGLGLTGECEQPHVRPWSSTVRFGTDGGSLWFKVNGPGTRHEPRLLSALARHAPRLGPDLLGVDVERGWTLMRDAGPQLRSLAPAEQLWDRWCTVLEEYAAAQLALSGALEDLVATGVDDLRPERLPSRFAELVDTLRRTPVHEGGLTADEGAALEALLPEHARWCDELAASGVPASVNHDDLHSANVCVSEHGTRVVDWGDAAVSHPFGTMLATLNSIAWHAGCERDDPRVVRVRDAYLSGFDGFGEHGDRVRWVGLARRTGCLSRALSYVHALEGESVSAHAELDWPVRGWLLETLER